jgi:general secretion pathway protein L
MSKRYVGIDMEGTEVRLAALTATAGKIDVVLDSRIYNSPEETAAAIREMLGGELALGDRLITALPCRVGLFRRLRFPFREKSKIKAALPLELAAQLPVSLEEQLITFLPPRARENDYEVDAIVVNRLEVEDMLLHFPDAEQHPRRIDFFPFGILPVLGGQEGILIYCRRLEVVVALIYDGMIWDYRLLPGTSELAEDEVLDFISNQVSQLENAIGQEGLPLWVMGAGVTDGVLKQLQQSGRTLLAPAEDVFGPDLECGMAPAALLALAELRSSKKGEQLNFRQGEFAARGQLDVFRSKLLAAGLLLLLVLIGGALSMHLGYLQKSQEHVRIKQQVLQVFRQTMPPGTAVVDAPLQLEGHLKELQKQVQLFGIGGQGVATVLQNLSKLIDPEIRIDLQEFNFNPDSIRLSGNTDSFDEVNRIAEQLEQHRMFKSVEIADAKLAADNSQVDFELQLQLYGGGER